MHNNLQLLILMIIDKIIHNINFNSQLMLYVQKNLEKHTSKKLITVFSQQQKYG